MGEGQRKNIFQPSSKKVGVHRLGDKLHRSESEYLLCPSPNPIFSCIKTLNGYTQKIPIFVLIANEKIRSYVIGLCKKNNLRPLIGADLEELVKRIKKIYSAIVILDYEVVNTYGARIYSRINVACTGCNAILLCDQDHRGLIKQAVDLGVYACILAPYEEWEVLTMIRNIIAKKKLRGRKKPYKGKELLLEISVLFDSNHLNRSSDKALRSCLL